MEEKKEPSSYLASLASVFSSTPVSCKYTSNLHFICLQKAIGMSGALSLGFSRILHNLRENLLLNVFPVNSKNILKIQFVFHHHSTVLIKATKFKSATRPHCGNAI